MSTNFEYRAGERQRKRESGWQASEPQREKGRQGLGGGGAGEETRSGTEKRCSHNLQSGHPAWWSAENCSTFPTVNIFRLFRSKKRPAEEIRNAN